jgi:hypothetical protein
MRLPAARAACTRRWRNAGGRHAQPTGVADAGAQRGGVNVVRGVRYRLAHALGVQRCAKAS